MKKSTTYYSRRKKSETVPTMSELASQKKSGSSPEEIFASLLDFDEHERHQRNSSTIGHALIAQAASGEYESTQYAIGQSCVREMTHIQKVDKGRASWFRAKDIEGRKYISRRSLKLNVHEKNEDEKEEDEKEYELRYFSPYEYSSSEESEFSDDEPTKLVRDNLTRAERRVLEQIPDKVKNSTVVLVREDVLQRDANPARSISQNTLMGQSAKEAYEDLFEQFKDLLSPKLILILKRAIEANIFVSPENEFRPEWLHKIAHSLSPISNKKEHDPQQKSNLGAAGKWANTEMMLLERIAKWFSLSEEAATVTLTSLFEMLFGSEVIRKIHFEVRVDFKERFIRFIQDIDVFKEFPTFRKTSDLAQTIAITDAIFSDNAPVRTERVSVVSSRSQPSQEVVAWQLPEEPREGELEDDAKALRILSSHPDFFVCKRIQDRFPIIIPEEPYYIVTIVDTETSGLDASENELIELAMLSFAVSKAKGFLGVVGTYEGLNQPKVPVSSDITRITGITNEQLEGQTIQWDCVREILSRTKYVVCHNVRFDRAFLEQQTPEDIQERVKSMQFACTLEDINWYARGYDPRKLDYLNFKLGYFYEAHRALNDCFATLNLLRNVPGVFDELIYNAHKKHMYFFSNRLIGSKNAAPIGKAEGIETYDMSTQTEADEAYALLSALPQYKIYKAVPKLLPTPYSLGAEAQFITIVDLKTTGANYLTDQITEVSMLSFSMVDGHIIVADSFKDTATTEHPIDWRKPVAMLNRTQYVLSHKNNINRKFLESAAPPEVRRKVQSLPCASTALDIDWKKWSASNNTLKYLSFVFGYYFDPDCLMSQNCATLNLLQVVPGVLEELLISLDKRQTVILLTGPFCSAINRELKSKGFQWSTGSGKMGKGWWACVDYDDTDDTMKWLLDAKEQAPGKNEIYFRVITSCERYSVRAEFKAVEMQVVGKKRGEKRPLEEVLSCSGPK